MKHSIYYQNKAKKTRTGISPFGIYYLQVAKTLHTSEYDYFRRLLVEARTKSQLTQLEVANKLQRPQSFVAKYEAGERRLDIVEFLQICLALDAEPTSILAELSKKVTLCKRKK